MKSLIYTVFAAAVAAQKDIDMTSQGQFKLKNAAFVSPGKFEDSEDFLLVSTFGVMSSGYVYMVPGIKDAVKAGDVSNLEPVKLDTGKHKFQWPNNVQVVPEDVFGERAIVVPDGFLVPGKKNGGVWVIRMDPSDLTKTVDTVKLTGVIRNNYWFYHMGYWVDLNGDGRKDFLTARSNAKEGEGELLWLEHPEGGLDSGEYWNEHILDSGADVTIDMQTLPEYPNEVVVFSAHFFDKALRMHRISTIDGSKVQSKTIDDTEIGSAYSVQMTDLNSDGSRQLLVNNHETKNKKTGIYAYEFPADPMNDDWTRRTIASDFHNAFSMTVPNMSPGFSYAVWPNGGQDSGERAHIFVAGDGDHSAHVLHPSGDWTQYEYEDEIFANAKGTVGCLAFSDLDEDNWQEVWMPNYNKSYIELWKVSPKATAQNFTQ